MENGTLFVISAPSGAGKSTLIQRIRTLFPEIVYSVSCTTRSPRPDEVNGIHYYFITEDEFSSLVAQGEFLEWKEVHGNFYGTPLKPVRESLREGKSMILDIDVQGAAEVFARFEAAVGIFIVAPSREVLEARLRARGTDSEESIRRRLQNATAEMKMAEMFHYCIVNEDLEKATQQLAAIIRRETERNLSPVIPVTSR